MKQFPAKQKCVYTCSVFRWWCRRVTSYQCDPELPILLLARLCAAFENVVASLTIKGDDMKSECLDMKKRSLGNGMVASKKVEIDSKLSGSYLNTEKSNLENCMTGEIGAQQEVLLETVQDLNHVNRKEPVDSSCNVVSSEGSATLNETITSDNLPSITSNHIPENKIKVNPCTGNVTQDIKSEIEQIIWCVVKYAPTSHLMASVANKLKKLYEL